MAKAPSPMSTSASTPHNLSAMDATASATPPPAAPDAFPEDEEAREHLFGQAKSSFVTAAEEGSFADFFHYLPENRKKLQLDSEVAYLAACLKTAVLDNKEKLRKAAGEMLRALPQAPHSLPASLVPRAFALLNDLMISEGYDEELPKAWDFIAEILASALSPKAGALKLRLSDFADAFRKADYKAKDLLAFLLMRVQAAENGDKEVQRLWAKQKLMDILTDEEQQGGLVEKLTDKGFPKPLMQRIEGEVVDSPEASDAEDQEPPSDEDEDGDSSGAGGVDARFIELDRFITKSGELPKPEAIFDFVSANLAGEEGKAGLVRALFTALMAATFDTGSLEISDAFGEAAQPLALKYVQGRDGMEAALLSAVADFCKAKDYPKGLLESLADVLTEPSLPVLPIEALSAWLADPATPALISCNGHLKNIVQQINK